MRLATACSGLYERFDHSAPLLTKHPGARYTANNFNAPMAKNAKLTIVEVSFYSSGSITLG